MFRREVQDEVTEILIFFLQLQKGMWKKCLIIIFWIRKQCTIIKMMIVLAMPEFVIFTSLLMV